MYKHPARPENWIAQREGIHIRGPVLMTTLGCFGGRYLLMALLAVSLMAGFAGTSVFGGELGSQVTLQPGIRLGDVSVAANADEIEVPIYVRNTADVDGIRLGVDYDELFLSFVAFREIPRGWLYAGLSEDDGTTDGRSSFELSLVKYGEEPEAGEEYVVGILLFRPVAALSNDASNDATFRASTRVGLGDAVDSYFYRFASNSAEVPVHQESARLADGTVTIYFADGVELAWGHVSPTPQEITIPVYVTLLRPVAGQTLRVGVDYDELFLRFTDGDAAGVARPGRLKTRVDEMLGTVEFDLDLGVEAAGGNALLQAHVADLTFNYNGEVPEGGTLDFYAWFVDGRAETSVAAGQAGTTEALSPSQIEVTQPYLVRGNVDAQFAKARDGRLRYSIGITDITLMLERLVGGRSSLPCAAAADVNGSGALDLSDLIHLLNHLYRSGPPPAAPFPAAAALESPSDLDCRESLPVYQPVEPEKRAR